jgi:hypothetical protein
VQSGQCCRPQHGCRLGRVGCALRRPVGRVEPAHALGGEDEFRHVARREQVLVELHHDPAEHGVDLGAGDRVVPAEQLFHPCAVRLRTGGVHSTHWQVHASRDGRRRS